MINIVKCLVFSVTAIGIFFQSDQISDAIVAEIELFYTTFSKKYKGPSQLLRNKYFYMWSKHLFGSRLHWQQLILIIRQCWKVQAIYFTSLVLKFRLTLRRLNSQGVHVPVMQDLAYTLKVGSDQSENLTSVVLKDTLT